MPNINRVTNPKPTSMVGDVIELSHDAVQDLINAVPMKEIEGDSVEVLRFHVNINLSNGKYSLIRRDMINFLKCEYLKNGQLGRTTYYVEKELSKSAYVKHFNYKELCAEAIDSVQLGLIKTVLFSSDLTWDKATRFIVAFNMMTNLKVKDNIEQAKKLVQQYYDRLKFSFVDFATGRNEQTDKFFNFLSAFNHVAKFSEIGKCLHNWRDLDVFYEDIANPDYDSLLPIDEIANIFRNTMDNAKHSNQVQRCVYLMDFINDIPTFHDQFFNNVSLREYVEMLAN